MKWGGLAAGGRKSLMPNKFNAIISSKGTKAGLEIRKGDGLRPEEDRQFWWQTLAPTVTIAETEKNGKAGRVGGKSGGEPTVARGRKGVPVP